MYATLSYDLNAGPQPLDEVRNAIASAFADRATCELLGDTFICEIDATSDYLALAKALRAIGNTFPGQFLYVFTLHRTGSPLRSNAAFSSAAADAIIDPEDE